MKRLWARHTAALAWCEWEFLGYASRLQAMRQPLVNVALRAEARGWVWYGAGGGGTGWWFEGL